MSKRETVKTSTVVENGTLLEAWLCDVNEYGDIKSNSSQEFLMRYNDKEYVVWMKMDDTPVNPDEMIDSIEFK